MNARMLLRAAFAGAVTLLAASGCSSPKPTPEAEEVDSGSIESTPLDTASPSELADGAKLFSRLDASETGIDFVHQWNPPTEHAAQLRASFTGSGVAIGDYDGDGKLDIFMTRQTDVGRLYRNLGDFRFEDTTEKAGIAIPSVPMWSTGATFADVNNDGNLDLYVCGFDCPNRLYLNQGNGTFKEGAKTAGLDFAGAGLMMAFSDYDLDGDLDGYLLTNRILPKDIKSVPASAYKRNADGSYTVDEQYREYVDIIQKPDGGFKQINAAQYDHLYRNDGSSGGQVRFTDVSKESGIAGNHYGLSAVWWDYNGDGLPDLYVSNDFYGPDKLYRNNGPGAKPAFTDVLSEVLPHTPWFSMGADVGDINNDGRFDFIATDMAGSNHYRDKMSMGNMSGPDSDSWFLNSTDPPQYMRNAVYLNSGTDRFMEVAWLTGLAGTDWTWSVKFADFDNDGREDLFASNGMSRDWMNGDLQAEAKTHSVAGDPLASLVAENRFWEQQPKLAQSNRAMRNGGDLHFDDVSGDWGLDHEGVSYGAASGDLDGDGDLDLVVMNFEEPAGVYRNNAEADDEQHRVVVRLVGTESNRWGIGARVQIETAGDPGLHTRYLTLSRGFMSSDAPLAHFGLGAQREIVRLTVNWPSGREQVFESLEADRHYVITEPRDGKVDPPSTEEPTPWFVRSPVLDGVEHSEREFDDFARQPLLPNKHSELGPGIAFADVNGDGYEEFYLGRAAGESGRVYHNSGPKVAADKRMQVHTFKPFEQDAKCEDMAPLFFDADGDGDFDLYVVSGGVECEPGDVLLRDRLYLNESEPGGKPTFVKAPQGVLPDLRDSGSTVVAADFDRDGDLDLFVGSRIIPGQYPMAPASRLLENRQDDSGFRFVDVTDELAPGLKNAGMVTGSIWSDADGDGWLDLLVTYDWGPVRFFRNVKGKLEDQTEEAGLAKRTGWYNAIAARDVDNDGDIDYAVANFGLNTKYHAPDPSHPQLIFYGDVDGSGKPHIVEAKFETQPDGSVRCYPIRGLGCSGDAMPSVRKKLPTFHKFAISELTEIYSQPQLDNATRFEVTSLESGLLINDGDGRFTFKPLPRLAQASPVFGMVFCDADADGNADLYLAQNFYSPQAETGRMDGGVSLLLLGRGDGTYAPVAPDKSGLVVRGDARSLALTDLNGDGWQDFVVGVNQGELLGLENQFSKSGGSSSRPFGVTLEGRPGNPQAVGARVTVRFESGIRQTAEIYAGGGYLSQGSDRLQFGIPDTSQKIVNIEVVWPDGSSSRREISADDRSANLLWKP